MPKLLPFIAIILLSVQSTVAAPLPVYPLAALAGESLFYDIAFVCFDRIAEGRFSFVAGDRPGTYRAELEAKTLGVAGWLTGDRVHHYRTIMEEKDGRLRPLYHESSIVTRKGNKEVQRGKSYLFDYEHEVVRYERVKNGVTKKKEVLSFARSAAPKDFLTAFIAFRAGESGPLLPGRRYSIGARSAIVDTKPPTLPDSGRTAAHRRRGKIPEARLLPLPLEAQIRNKGARYYMQRRAGASTASTSSHLLSEIINPSWGKPATGLYSSLATQLSYKTCSTAHLRYSVSGQARRTG